MGNELVGPGNFWGDMSPSDFAIPRVDIGQPTSEREAGRFNYNTGASLETMPGCKLLVPRKTRVLYRSAMKASRCASDDYYKPAERVKAPISQSCMTCFAADWGDDEPKKQLAEEIGKTGNINPPLCKETYNLLMLDADNHPFFIKFQGTQLKVVQEKLFSRLKFDHSKVPPHLVQFDMALGLVIKPGTKYYTTEFSNFEVSDEESHETIDMFRNKFASLAQDILAKQHEQMDKEHAE